MLVFNLLGTQVFAAEFDTSINDDIRKNYNPSKLEEDMALPALPKIYNENNNNIQPVKANHTSKPIQKYKSYSKVEQSYIVLKKGTKIKLKSLNNVSDTTAKGTKLTFVSTYPISTTYYTIPTGTVFKGFVLNSHGPQLSGNGGLIVLGINSIILNDEIQPIDAYVTKAKSKMIFFNNIKGKRKYMNSMLKAMKPGCNYFKKMLKITGILANDRSSIILTPFSLSAGVLGLAGNIIISPVKAIFHKGNSIYISAGSEFEIKLSQDVFIYN